MYTSRLLKAPNINISIQVGADSVLGYTQTLSSGTHIVDDGDVDLSRVCGGGVSHFKAGEEG